jgi:hypothetical protein
VQGDLPKEHVRFKRRNTEAKKRVPGHNQHLLKFLKTRAKFPCREKERDAKVFPQRFFQKGDSEATGQEISIRGKNPTGRGA